MLGHFFLHPVTKVVLIYSISGILSSGTYDVNEQNSQLANAMCCRMEDLLESDYENIC